MKDETLEIIKHLVYYFLRRDGWEPEMVFNQKTKTIEIRLMDNKYYRGEGE